MVSVWRNGSRRLRPSRAAPPETQWAEPQRPEPESDPQRRPRTRGKYWWIVRRAVGTTCGLLAVVLLVSYATNARSTQRQAEPGGGYVTGSGTVSAPAPSSAASDPGLTVPPGLPSVAALPGLADPAAVYSFTIPSDFTVAWAPAAAGAQDGALDTQFRALFSAFMEAWAFGDVNDPRYRLWCQAGCEQTLDATVTEWAAAKLVPIGRLTVYAESTQTAHEGTVGAAEVCVDYSGLKARNQDQQTLADPFGTGPVLYLFDLAEDPSAGRWIAVSARPSTGDARCGDGP